MSSPKIHFEISERKMILYLFDLIFVWLGLYTVGYFFDFEYLESLTTEGVPALVLAIYLSVFGLIFEMYKLQVASNEFQILRSTILTASTTAFVYLLTPIFSPELPSNRIQILAFFVMLFSSLMVWRLFYVRFLASNRFMQTAILVCENQEVEKLILGLEDIDPHYKIIGYVSADEVECDNARNHYVAQIMRNNLASFVKEHSVSEIVIASQRTDGITTVLYQQLLHLLESGNVIREYTQVYESKTQRIPVHYMARDFYSFFPFSRSNQNKLYQTIVRGLDIILSIIGVIFGVALLPLIGIGNILGNPGPLFYVQKRVGKDGVAFDILKLRTMVKNAENDGAVFASCNDSRITRFGKFLRKTRMDEIPQCINILKGDMAVVGPRPERPEFVKEIADRMPFYETRHVIKPGLTGWAQVNYSYGETIEDSLIKLQYDLYYIKHRSFYLDLNIALKTITTVLFYRGQ
ncbi:exopolysaccharide biosynthesis polyprenyl glycosylphosphotransferase [Flavobacterium kayseriense]|nr:exopolysaccharide biosynthesis polyprenyl glycosylphosphotransferase [Flavobacterium kayseriense]